MYNERYWDLFEKSGSIYAYLAYKNNKQSKFDVSDGKESSRDSGRKFMFSGDYYRD